MKKVQYMLEQRLGPYCNNYIPGIHSSAASAIRPFYTKATIEKKFAKTTSVNVVLGISGMEKDKARMIDDFFYVDHGYFKREWTTGFFRLIRNNLHLTRVIGNHENRLEKFGVEIQPYRKTGRSILVVSPGEIMAQFLGIEGIGEAMAEECRKYTDRPVYVKPKDGTPLMHALRDVWAVVCPVSVGGVDAAMAGIPVFSTPMCPSWPINSGDLKDLDNPTYPERYEWANSLAWSTWHFDEIPFIPYKTYQQCES
jgi:hypothetical protein